MKSKSEYKVFFRIWPMRYFLARELNFEYLCIVKKEFDNIYGKYYYEEI